MSLSSPHTEQNKPSCKWTRAEINFANTGERIVVGGVIEVEKYRRASFMSPGKLGAALTMARLNNVPAYEFMSVVEAAKFYINNAEGIGGINEAFELQSEKMHEGAGNKQEAPPPRSTEVYLALEELYVYIAPHEYEAFMDIWAKVEIGSDALLVTNVVYGELSVNPNFEIIKMIGKFFLADEEKQGK